MMQTDTSKIYAIEHIAMELKVAREAKGLTQRELSKRTGVPQAHISKIENNTVDLRLSSLLALAHSLDLELTLVPRKALPAVQSLTRTAGTNYAAPQISKDLARTYQALDRLRGATPGAELVQLSDTINDIIHLQSALSDGEAARALRKAVDAIHSSEDTKALRAALAQAKALRNAIVHHTGAQKVTEPRPAYRLEDDIDG